MPELKIREIDFQFDEATPYYWNPGNPDWGNFVNYITLFAPAFERYFIKTIRAAIPKTTSPEVAKDADLFCKQEGLHSKHHMAHLNVLIKQHPGLEELRDLLFKSYQDLFENEPLEFHLAYAAIVELGFGPMAKFSIVNRDKLFVDADPKIASFILWHLVEEFEHRNSAIDVYNDVVGSYWYRIKSIPKVVKHLMSLEEVVRLGLQEHVPPLVTESGKIEASDVDLFIKPVPVKNQLVFFYEMFCSLLPFHKPDSLQQPEWVDDWFKAEEAGVDMRTYYMPTRK